MEKGQLELQQKLKIMEEVAGDIGCDKDVIVVKEVSYQLDDGQHSKLREEVDKLKARCAKLESERDENLIKQDRNSVIRKIPRFRITNETYIKYQRALHSTDIRYRMN